MKRGVALPTVVLALAMTSALVVGGAFVTRQLASSALIADRSAALEPAAEDAITAVVASWDSVARSAQLVGTTEHLAAQSIGGVQTEAWITRISSRSYWLVAESRSGARPSLRRRIGLILCAAQGAPAQLPERAWSELP